MLRRIARCVGFFLALFVLASCASFSEPYFVTVRNDLSEPITLAVCTSADCSKVADPGSLKPRTDERHRRRDRWGLRSSNCLWPGPCRRRLPAIPNVKAASPRPHGDGEPRCGVWFVGRRTRSEGARLARSEAVITAASAPPRFRSGLNRQQTMRPSCIAAEAATWVPAARQLLVAGSGHAALAERLRFRSPRRRTLAGASACKHQARPRRDPGACDFRSCPSSGHVGAPAQMAPIGSEQPRCRRRSKRRTVPLLRTEATTTLEAKCVNRLLSNGRATSQGAGDSSVAIGIAGSGAIRTTPLTECDRGRG